MSRQSTALLTVGPRSISPWGDRAWRVSGSAQLVQGSGAYWLVTPTSPAEHIVSPDVVQVEVPYADAVVDSLLLLLGTWFGGDAVEAYLGEVECVHLVDGVRQIAPYWELADETVRFLAAHLSSSVRLGVTILDEFSLVDEAVIAALRGLGFDVDVFVLGSLPSGV
jgi:hypothetical protein